MPGSGSSVFVCDGNMRIAQVTPVYPPRGGIGTVAQEYEHQLREAGDDVEVFTPRYDQPIVKWGNAALMVNLLWRLRGFDVIHLHYPFYGGAIFAALASFFWRIPLVVTYHMKTKADGWLGLVFILHRQLLEPLIMHQASAVLVSSRDYADSVHFAHPRLEELPFGVDAERFSPGDGSAVRKKFGIPDDAFVFLFVGGMDDAHYFKGVDHMLRAFSKLPEDECWHAVFVGAGNRLADYERLAAELELQNCVHFAGFVSSEDLPSYYRAADIHLLPSIDRSEAFGLVTIEAASAALPSIVSDLPGVRTLVDPGATGLIVRPGDQDSLVSALKEVLRREDVAQMGAAARKRVLEGYDRQLVVQKLQSIYQRAKVNKL